jgi:shikimate dehydrogenase
MAIVTVCASFSLHPSPFGAAMHNAGYRALNLPFTYVPFAVRDLRGAIAGMRALGIRGAGVSFPHKQAVMALLDAIEPVAARIGAVNTIVNDSGTLTGHNTDWVGAVRALEEVTALAGERVLLVGAGGAARAIAYGLHGSGAQVTIANRDVAKAEELARAVGAEARALSEVERAADYGIVVNATVLGMIDVDPRSPIPEAAIRPGQLVMDIVFKPPETQLLAAARARGARVIDGGRMLVHQAARQFELYTGRTAPLEAMEAALRAAIG